MALALGDADVAGAAQVGGGFAQGAARQEVFVAEGGLAVDQHEIQPVLEGKVLEAVVEDERVRAEVFDGVPAGLDAVLVHEHDDAGQVGGEHEGLVAGFARAEQHAFVRR